MNAREAIKRVVEWCGVLLVVVVALPIVAIGLFVLRFALLGALALAAAVMAAGYCVFPAVRRWARETLRTAGADHTTTGPR